VASLLHKTGSKRRQKTFRCQATSKSRKADWNISLPSTCYSPPLIAELKNILNAKIGTPQEIISDFIELLTQDSILPEKTTLANIDIRDKDDIVIISTALNGNAEIVVTGDKELLELGIVQSMQIVSPRMFWEALKTQPPDELWSKKLPLFVKDIRNVIANPDIPNLS